MANVRDLELIRKEAVGNDAEAAAWMRVRGPIVLSIFLIVLILGKNQQFENRKPISKLRVAADGILPAAYVFTETNGKRTFEARKIKQALFDSRQVDMSVCRNEVTIFAIYRIMSLGPKKGLFIYPSNSSFKKKIIFSTAF